MEYRCENCGDWYFSAYSVETPEPSLCPPCKDDLFSYDDEPPERERTTED